MANTKTTKQRLQELAGIKPLYEDLEEYNKVYYRLLHMFGDLKGNDALEAWGEKANEDGEWPEWEDVPVNLAIKEFGNNLSPDELNTLAEKIFGIIENNAINFPSKDKIDYNDIKWENTGVRWDKKSGGKYLDFYNDEDRRTLHKRAADSDEELDDFGKSLIDTLEIDYFNVEYKYLVKAAKGKSHVIVDDSEFKYYISQEDAKMMMNKLKHKGRD
tara:strand:+ start:304 stop:951 length:648 start_codon:yes stop_codon:yes gene_type:complete